MDVQCVVIYLAHSDKDHTVNHCWRHIAIAPISGEIPFYFVVDW